MSRPVRLALGAVSGALLAAALGGRAAVEAGLAVIVLLAFVAVARPPLARRAVPFAIGLLLIGLRAAVLTPPAVTVALPSGSGPWTATVQSVSSPRNGTRPAVLAIEVPAGLVVAATLPWYPEVAPGDRVEVGGRLEPPSDDDYGSYLRRIGAAGTVRATSLELARLPEGAGGIGPWESMRRASAVAIDRAIPAPESGLADGILIGLRDHVDRDLAAAFTTAGVSHIVAISGWNIAIVATTLGALTGRLRRRRRTLATCLAIAIYVAFVGPSPSVVRAAAMAACALLARDLGRPTTATAAMGLAVSGLLVIDPSYVDDAGFRLSVLATAGLIAWGTQLAAWLASPSPGAVRAWLAESLGVSLAAQAATLPVILMDFGRLSLVSPVVNVLVAPFVAPFMAAGGVALVGGLAAGAGLPGPVATVVGLPAWFLLGLIVGIVRAGAGLPFASVGLEPPANAIAALIAAVGVAAIARVAGRRRRGRSPVPPPASRQAAPKAAFVGAPDRRAVRGVGLLLGAALTALGIAFVHRPDGATRITVLDVGQGDAILVEGGRGGRLLVDGGPDPGRLQVVLDERLPPWDRRIDALVLTHPHEDHVAGLVALLGHEHIGRVFESGLAGPGPGYKAWESELSATSPAIEATSTGAPTRWALATGDTLDVDDVHLRVLWPDPGSLPSHLANDGSAINNESVVLLGEVEGHRFLLTGDMEEDVDPALIERGLPTLDFLKVAHHGSRTATTQAFLDATKPRVAVVSVGEGNSYGHPAPATITRLEASGASVFRTDRDGSVTVTFNGAATRVQRSGGRAKAQAWDSGAGGNEPATTGPPTAAALPVSAPSLELPRPPSAAGTLGSSRYHRPDDGSVPGGGGPRAPVPRSPRLAPAPFARRRGSRGLARAPHRGARADRSPVGRNGRAPPRRRQGHAEASAA